MSMNGQPAAASGARSLVVVIVGDSRTGTRRLRGLLAGPGFTVAAEVCTAAAAEAAVVEHQPGAVLIDLAPADGGIEAIERIMGTRPTPIVVCGSLVAHSGEALAAGAVDVVGALDELPGSPEYAVTLCRHLRVASRVRVITHPRNRLRVQGVRSGPVPVAAPRRPGSGEPLAQVVPLAPPADTRRVKVVVIGASTGGPPALATILAGLPLDLPVPVLVVQHMADGFVEGLASWLDSLSPLPVVMAEHGKRLLAGTVHVAPAKVNTVLRPGLRVELRTPPAGQFHVPGVDAAFTSAADVCGAATVGVLLTGMGRDGAEGLRLLHQAGALTIGQDEPTSVVWGMPAAAQALGAVELELPLAEIAAALTTAVVAQGVST